MREPTTPRPEPGADQALLAALRAMRRRPSPWRPGGRCPPFPPDLHLTIPRGDAMDPDACLARLLDAAVAGDAAELRQAADDLAGWLERGGVAPRDPRTTEP